MVWTATPISSWIKQGFRKMKFSLFHKKQWHADQFLAKSWPLYRKLEKCKNSSTMDVFDGITSWNSIFENPYISPIAVPPQTPWSQPHPRKEWRPTMSARWNMQWMTWLLSPIPLLYSRRESLYEQCLKWMFTAANGRLSWDTRCCQLPLGKHKEDRKQFRNEWTAP